MLWFTKAKRASNDQDYESWNEGGMNPTLNVFDSGDVRATTLVATTIRFRGGKPGGGKGPLLSEGMSQVLTTAADQILFAVEREDVPTYPIDTRNALRDPDKKDEMNRQGVGLGEDGDPSSTLTGSFVPGVGTDYIVRRLTPVECERLQGFPDDWTSGNADSHRYKQMGNAVAVPVVEWIIQNICDTL